MPAITNVNELQAMNDDLAGYYWLANDIDASATVGWNGGAGFVPVGPFTGIFDGKCHTISDLFINRLATQYVGLFSILNAATAKDVTLENVDITGKRYIGSLAGDSEDAIITECYATGSIEAVTYGHTGGLLGTTDSCELSDCYAAVTVIAVTDYAGGFVGRDYGNSHFTKCYAIGNATGRYYIGGFFGQADGLSTFSECYSSGNANGENVVGGFGGYGVNMTADDCYTRGDAIAVGGVSCHAGGFVQDNDSGIITHCYSTGLVTGADGIGGFCETNSGTITDCFWDENTSGTAVSAGGTGKTTAEMKTKSTFTDADWDFIIIWFINGITNNGYPFFFTMPPEPTPDAPRDTVDVQDEITLKSIRNVEMAAGGRFYVNKEGKATYKSRYARNA